MPDRVNGSDHEPFVSLCDESPERAMMPPPSPLYERHTADIDCKPIQQPEKSRGAVWAWVAVGVIVVLYVWKHWPK